MQLNSCAIFLAVPLLLALGSFGCVIHAGNTGGSGGTGGDGGMGGTGGAGGGSNCPADVLAKAMEPVPPIGFDNPPAAPGKASVANV